MLKGIIMDYFLFTRTMIRTSSIVIEAQTLRVLLAEIWIHRSHVTPWLPSDQPVQEQTKLMSQQRGTKHSYKLFSLLHSYPYILVWCPMVYIIWTMVTAVNSTNLQPLSSVIRSFPLINPSPFGIRLGFISGRLPLTSNSGCTFVQYTYWLRFLYYIYIYMLGLSN